MSLGSSSIHTEEPKVLALKVSQSAYGAAIARVWGTHRVPGNLLDYVDFKAIAHTTSSGGKGGVDVSSTTYTYRVAAAMAICSGPIAGIGIVWKNKDKVALEDMGLTLMTGELGQASWSYMLTKHPERAVPYSGIAYVAGTVDLGNSSGMPNMTFEVRGERIIEGGNGDAAAADVITDIVSDGVEGIGLPASVLADMTNYRAWCSAMDLTVSVAATAQQAAGDLIRELLKATMAEAIWSQSKLKLVPYGDHPVGTWTPNTTPAYDLGEGDLLSPPRLVRKQPADAINRVTVNYTDRDNDYNAVPLTRDDLAAVTQYGPRPETLDLNCITRGAMAGTVCEFWRDRNLYIRNTWELDVDERFCRLEPMDLLTLSYGPQLLDHVPVCIVSIEESGDENGELTLLVEEWPFGLSRPTALPVLAPTGYIPQQAVAPGPVNDPVIFEAPNILTAPALEIWIGASGGADWGGCNVWISDTGDSYQQVGVIESRARHGILAQSLLTGVDPDVTHTLYVDLSVSAGELQSVTQTDADNLNTLLWVDGELIAFETATLTAPNCYSLTYLRRGAYGTPISTHSLGAQMLRLDDAVFKYGVPRERIGSPIWIKLQSFNLFGQSPEPLDTVAPITYTIQGNKPLPVASLTATGGLFENRLAWSFVAGQVGIDGVEIWGATTDDRSAASSLTFQKKTVTDWKHPGLQPGQDWYYWARVVDTAGNQGDWVPESPTAGVHASPSTDPSSLLTQLQGAVGLEQLANELAQPIVETPGAANAVALAAIQSALSDYDLTNRMQWQEAVTNATIDVDPVTGKIQLLATANVTTDVEARLTAVEVEADADHATLTSTVATLTTVQGNLTTAQSNITQLQDQITSTASEVYVDNAVANATGEITVTAANGMSALAQAEIQSALDSFTQAQTARDLTANVALAQDSIKANADALAAEATSRSSLVATVANQGAAITAEQTARATADSAEATAREALAARVTTAEGNITANAAAISTEATARANADSAEATARETLAARVTTAENDIAANEAAITTEQTARANGDSANASSIAQVSAVANARNTIFRQDEPPTANAAGDLWFDSNDNNKAYRWNGSVWVATDDARIAANAAAITTEQTARANGDSANASSIAAVSARLDTGDFATVKTTAEATADALGDVEARWGVEVATMADNVRAVAGLKLLAGTDGESVFAILADKLLVYKPDGTGVPKQIVTLGEINGLVALGLDGNLIIDGSVVARSLAVESLDAITATIGTLRTADSGARMEIHDNVIKVFDSGNTLRVQLGDLSL